MSADLELVWPLSIPLLLMLGATAWLCVRCSRPGVKRNEKIFEQRNQQENEQNFTVAQTYSRPESLRYQNFYRGSRHEPDAAYVDPIPTDYYNWGRFQKSPEDDDSDSYENVLICKPSTPDSGGEESEDYQNSISIREWRESRRTVGAQVSPLESPDEEPDYVNGDVAAAEQV